MGFWIYAFEIIEYYFEVSMQEMLKWIKKKTPKRKLRLQDEELKKLRQFDWWSLIKGAGRTRRMIQVQPQIIAFLQLHFTHTIAFLRY